MSTVIDGSASVTINSGAVLGITSGTALSYTQATNSGTTLDFTGIPSWVKRITVMFNGVSTSGTSNYLIQLGDSGGVEITNYKSVGSYTTGATGAAASSTAGFVLNTGASAARTINGTIILSLFDKSTNLWIASGLGGFEDVVYVWMVTGSKSLSDTLTQIRITSVTPDTFDAGSINILYE